MSAPSVFLIAGEPSGDLLGGRLMAALREKTGDSIAFFGIGGETMTAQGLDSLFPMKELSVMGLAEVIPHLPRLLSRIKQTVKSVKKIKPDLVITIDSPGFCFRVAQQLKGQGCLLVHYVAPSVWAWKPKRARQIARFIDHLLALLPFEPPYFEKEGLRTTFVGHPILESGAADGDGDRFRQHHGISKDATLLCLLPGSRSGEINRLMPVFGATLERLSIAQDSLSVVIPTIAHHQKALRKLSADWPVSPFFVSDERSKYDAFAAADAALAASGTVALELAMAATPAVIAYRLNPLTAQLARRLVKTPYVSLVNLLLNREAIPELLLEDCRAKKLAAALNELLKSDAARAKQRAAYDEALAQLRPQNAASPSRRAAKAVLDLIDSR